MDQKYPSGDYFVYEGTTFTTNYKLMAGGRRLVVLLFAGRIYCFTYLMAEVVATEGKF